MRGPRTEGREEVGKVHSFPVKNLRLEFSHSAPSLGDGCLLDGVQLAVKSLACRASCGTVGQQLFLSDLFITPTPTPARPPAVATSELRGHGKGEVCC